MEEELLKVEKGFVDAIAKNDLDAIERFVTDDWIISMPMEESSTGSVFLR